MVRPGRPMSACDWYRLRRALAKRTTPHRGRPSPRLGGRDRPAHRRSAAFAIGSTPDQHSGRADDRDAHRTAGGSRGAKSERRAEGDVGAGRRRAPTRYERRRARTPRSDGNGVNDLVALGGTRRLRAVLAAAQKRGIDNVLSAGSQADLAAFADAARYGRKTQLARRALLSERKRFPGAAAARGAASFWAASRRMDHPLLWAGTRPTWPSRRRAPMLRKRSADA